MKNRTFMWSILLSLTVTLFAGCAAGVLESDDSERALADQKQRVSNHTLGTKPIQALYITSFGNVWHDYLHQKEAIMEGVGRYANIEFSLVGKDPEDALELMKQEHFSAGYDVVVYNMCFPDDTDLERINNIISQTRDLGVPAVLLHCAMHSFQETSPSLPENRLELMALEYEWAENNPDVDFPHWWEFTGVDSLTHDWPRAFTADRFTGDHPITARLPLEIQTRNDELYTNLQVMDGVEPLYTAFSRKSRRDHVVAWTHEVGAGQVFATTLGHDHNTSELNDYHHLVANGILYVTGRLQKDGIPAPGYEGTETVDNYQGTTVCQPSDVIEAANLVEVQSAVRRAARENKALKVISVKKSNSNSGFICPEQGGILLNLWQMNQILDLDRDTLTVTVQPGIRAVHLSSYLHEHGFAIRAMPDYTGVSIAGGIATAAHHSSLQFASSMADIVESIKIVDGEGNLRVFEGYDAARVSAHLGMLGVVVEVTLTIEPQFKLRYGSESGSDAGLENNIESMVRDHPYARVMWFAGNGRYVLDYYDRVDNDTRGESQHNLWTSSGSAFRIVGDLPYRLLNSAPLRAQCDSALLRSKFWFPPISAKDSPRDAPVGWSHDMLASYCEPGQCPWDAKDVRSRTIEAAFPLRHLKQWMTDVRGIIEENRACFPILGIYLRFSAASDRWMGFNYGEDMVAFEIHIPKNAHEMAHERSNAVYDEILQMTLYEYNGRPHWGKNSNPAFVGVGPAQYPRWRDFIALKNELDPAGRFDNKIWAQMTGKATIKPYPGCVLARDCICSEDIHCGDGLKCVPGDHYGIARVCR